MNNQDCNQLILCPSKAYEEQEGLIGKDVIKLESLYKCRYSTFHPPGLEKKHHT